MKDRPTVRDDDLPKKKVTHDIGQDLTLLSVFELNERVILLQEEILRLETAAKAKSVAKGAADAFFKR
jgi:uncharacterized small protein (DUF1192 family)